MHAGPKRAVTAEPLDVEGLPAARAARVAAFCHRWVTVPKGVGALEPLRLRPWQREIVAGAYAPGVRQALVSIPRGNGKSALAAALGLAELFVGPPSAEVLVVASDQRQAEIVFRMARRMVELRPELAERVQVYRDRLYVPHSDSSFVPLPAEADALHGYDPSLLILDELHAVREDTWEAATSAAGKRAESLTLAISTPAVRRESVMWRLVEHGRAGTDPSFYLREFAAPAGCSTSDRHAWAEANPALGDFLAADALEAVRGTLRESTFRRLRLGQWTGGESAWISWEAWAACSDASRVVADGEPVVLGFDGSASGDSTALVGCTLDGHLFVVDVWANPGDLRWRVPRAEVGATVAAAFERWDVREVAADPWGWRSEIEAWAAAWPGRVVEWPTNVVSRMAPATDRLYAAVQERTASHDGDSRLASHVAHCVARPTAQGDLVTKDRSGSPRKIDAAVCAIVAFDRAAYYSRRSRRRSRMVSL